MRNNEFEEKSEDKISTRVRALSEFLDKHQSNEIVFWVNGANQLIAALVEHIIHGIEITAQHKDDINKICHAIQTSYQSFPEYYGFSLESVTHLEALISDSPNQDILDRVLTFNQQQMIYTLRSRKELRELLKKDDFEPQDWKTAWNYYDYARLLRQEVQSLWRSLSASEQDVLQCLVCNESLVHTDLQGEEDALINKQFAALQKIEPLLAQSRDKNDPEITKAYAMVKDMQHSCNETHKVHDSLLTAVNNYLLDLVRPWEQQDNVPNEGIANAQRRLSVSESSGFDGTLEEMQAQLSTEDDPVYDTEGQKLHDDLSHTREKFIETGDSNQFIHNIKPKKRSWWN